MNDDSVYWSWCFFFAISTDRTTNTAKLSFCAERIKVEKIILQKIAAMRCSSNMHWHDIWNWKITPHGAWIGWQTMFNLDKVSASASTFAGCERMIYTSDELRGSRNMFECVRKASTTHMHVVECEWEKTRRGHFEWSLQDICMLN